MTQDMIQSQTPDDYSYLYSGHFPALLIQQQAPNSPTIYTYHPRLEQGDSGANGPWPVISKLAF